MGNAVLRLKRGKATQTIGLNIFWKLKKKNIGNFEKYLRHRFD